MSFTRATASRAKAYLSVKRKGLAAVALGILIAAFFMASFVLVPEGSSITEFSSVEIVVTVAGAVGVAMAAMGACMILVTPVTIAATRMQGERPQTVYEDLAFSTILIAIGLILFGVYNLAIEILEPITRV